jgi:hypothetical protein
MDITMCTGLDCPFKEQCHRFTADPGEYQMYFADPPIKDGKCDFYWGENGEFVWNEIKDSLE